VRILATRRARDGMTGRTRARVAMVAVAACAAGSLAISTTPAVSAHPSTHHTRAQKAAYFARHGMHRWRSGVFAGYGWSNDAAFGHWRGARVRSATDFIPEQTWHAMSNPAWDIAQWRHHKNAHPVFSVPLFPLVGGASFPAAAAGTYDGHFKSLARSLVAGGLGHIVLRIGWEFNGSWYRWSVTNRRQAALYAEAWRSIVTAIRSVKGAHFTFVWNPDRQLSGMSPARAYPGNKYVDYVGMDAYDISPKPQTDKQRWHSIVHHGYGLDWQKRFANRHHKRLAFPEWGLFNRAFDPEHSGGDDPMYVRNMYEWFGHHNTAFENYFDYDTLTGTTYSMSKGRHAFPHATAEYSRLFSHT
jgi:hypothetical protein